MLCYCGSGRAFNQCCQPVISGSISAKNCTALMRSRYTAYCLHLTDYLVETTHASQRTNDGAQQIAAFAHSVHFIKLQVHDTQPHPEDQVSFSATYLYGNTLCQLSEISRFVKEDKWYYVDGILTEVPPQKIGRNDLCPCGSGKKFKQCSQHLLSGNS
ncbi:YchJ family metal-binding protein [Chromatiaceae bacterium AAb-1]|nr:YchJ family metal-binding protein [Chromatiaceae bacterium AAb-1]